MLSSEYKAILSMLHVQTNSITVRTTVELAWQRLVVWCRWIACWHSQLEGLGSSPIGYEQKENLLKVQDMKKQDKMIKN